MAEAEAPAKAVTPNDASSTHPPASATMRARLVRPRPSLRAWRNAIFGTLLVGCGLVVAVITSWARRSGDWELARVGAITSLVFVLLITIFVVPPLLRSARAEVGRLDPPFQITTGGLIFIGIFLSVAFAAYNTGNNLLFLIFSVLASALFVAWSVARAGLRDLVVSARFPDHIFAGEPAPVLVSLQNTKRLLPSFSILIESRNQVLAAPSAHDERDGRRKKRRRLERARHLRRTLAYFIYVPRHAKAEQRVEQLFPQRGHILVTGFELSTRFPFGFFRLRRRLRARNVELVIYPKLEAASDELHLLPMNAGRMLSARRGAGHDLHSLRHYQPQDDMRHIDWKATARTSRLIVREFASEDERRVHIVFDTRVMEGATDGGGGAEKFFEARFERGVTQAASLVAHFLEERAEVRLTLGAETGHYGAGREHLYACLRRLALVRPHEATGATGATTATGATGAAGATGATGAQIDLWSSLAAAASNNADSHYVILLTTSAPGTIPAHVWRMSHVIYL
ncbi:MAG TPA: DUF58 domain-containing protein [Pyrinomonadaceae bacterium]|nr:DUF58 domain-containing protein [Pyrinomonadaceae bacterium]